MNLAFCIFKYYPFGGLEKNFLRILQEVLERGHSVSVFTMSWDGEIPEFISRGKCRIVHVPCFGISNHGKCASYVKNLSPELKKGNFDLIVGFNRMPGLDLYYAADVCFIADIRRRRSFLYRITPRYRIFACFEKSIFSPVSKTHILALSDIQRKIYAEEYGTQENRFHPIPAGIDKEKIRKLVTQEQRRLFREALGLNEKETMLLMVGSDFIRKGVARSLMAIAALPKPSRDRVKLYILGKGKINRMLALSEKLNIKNNVVFTGPVSNVPEYLSAADFLLHPAVSENTGNTIVEALIAGVPVIATSNCGYAFHVAASGAGFIIEGINYSQDEFNQKLAEAITLPRETYQSWQNNALKYADATDFYSRPVAVADIIEKLVTEGLG